MGYRWRRTRLKGADGLHVVDDWCLELPNGDAVGASIRCAAGRAMGIGFGPSAVPAVERRDGLCRLRARGERGRRGAGAEGAGIAAFAGAAVAGYVCSDG